MGHYHQESEPKNPRLVMTLGKTLASYCLVGTCTIIWVLVWLSIHSMFNQPGQDLVDFAAGVSVLGGVVLSVTAVCLINLSANKDNNWWR